MKKTLIAGLIAISALTTAWWGTSALTANAADDKVQGSSFKDTIGHWSESAVNTAVEKGWVSGYPDGLFHPETNVTRAEFIKMTVAAPGLSVDTSQGGTWYVPYINTAQTAGLFQSEDFKDSNWEKTMTRLEMSTVAVRAIGRTDVEENQWMYLAAKDGVISGTSPGQLSPEGMTTRAQAVTVLQRIVTVKEGGTLPVDKYAVSAGEILWHRTNIMTVLPRYFSQTVDGLDFDFKPMSNQSPDGKASCQITQLVAIDLDDPKDPNRKIIESNEYAWTGNGKYYKLRDSSGYAIMEISETKITSKLSIDRLYPCQVYFQNDDWYNMPENANSPKSPNRSYGIMPWESKYDQFKFSVDVSKLKSGTVSFATGTLIPKGDFTSDKDFQLMFSGMGNWQGTMKTIYRGKLNTNFHQ